MSVQNDNTVFTINTHLLMNNWDIGGARNIGAADDHGGGNDIVAANKLKGRYLQITSTSTFTGDISDPNIYTQTHVESILTGKRISSDISTPIAGKPINQQHIPKPMLIVY